MSKGVIKSITLDKTVILGSASTEVTVGKMLLQRNKN
jgi:hypothetical protein